EEGEKLRRLRWFSPSSSILVNFFDTLGAASICRPVFLEPSPKKVPNLQELFKKDGKDLLPL
ncbi:MAG: hypothetical protein ACI3YH_07060, partial [Eubacteriales bacterium]